MARATLKVNVLTEKNKSFARGKNCFVQLLVKSEISS